MVTNLYLVRHGETDWNKENRCQGITNTELNQVGLRQAEALAKRLQNENIDCVYSSELNRAIKTAAIISEELNLDFKKEACLNEINFGNWQGEIFDELAEIDGYSYDEWINTPHLARFPGEGNLINVKKRTMKRVNDIIQENKGKNILMVSHGAILKVILLGILNMGLEQYNKIHFDNTSLNIITINNKNSYLRLLNDRCHLR